MAVSSRCALYWKQTQKPISEQIQLFCVLTAVLRQHALVRLLFVDSGISKAYAANYVDADIICTL